MFFARLPKIGEKGKQPIIKVYLNRPSKYSVKKLEVKSVKQKNLFETAAVWRVSYFSVAMNNNFRNILSALNFALGMPLALVLFYQAEDPAYGEKSTLHQQRSRSSFPSPTRGN